MDIQQGHASTASLSNVEAFNNGDVHSQRPVEEAKKTSSLFEEIFPREDAIDRLLPTHKSLEERKLQRRKVSLEQITSVLLWYNRMSGILKPTEALDSATKILMKLIKLCEGEKAKDLKIQNIIENRSTSSAFHI